MDGTTFVYEGRSGLWTYTICLLKSGEGNFSAVGDITLHGEQRCKLVLCRQRTSTEAGVDILKRRCVAWIEKVEKADTEAETEPADSVP